MPKRGAQGAGSIRKKTVVRNNKEYTYWEARVTIGRDPGTGKQIQQSFSGKTQKEVREKMQAAAVAVNTGTYIPPAKLTVGQWCDIWSKEYIGNLKPSTARSYNGHVKNHIKPSLGAIKLTDLSPHHVQIFVNGLEGLSASTIRKIYKITHLILEKAVILEYIPKNPTDHCVLPKPDQKEIVPLTDTQASTILELGKGTEIQNMLIVALFTGLRISELLGLTWDCISMDNQTITVNKQLTHVVHRNTGVFATTKNGKSRNISVAPSVINALKDQHIRQVEMRLRAGKIWNNEYNLVFTLEDGQPYEYSCLRWRFKKLLEKAGFEGIRFHDLRHTYAVNSIRAGDDVKTIQGNLGHASAAFTLDKYGHFTEKMKQESADRMEAFIKGTLNL